MPRVWGLDIGTTSVGFAVLDLPARDVDAEMGGRILHAGVRIFPEGVTEKEREPRNKARRQARLTRRQIRRRRQRKAELGRILYRAGLAPAFDSPDWADFAAIDPYDARKRALEERLSPFEIGRCFYHLAKHRGFLGNKLIEAEQSEERAKEAQGIKSEIDELRARLGDRTLGAWLADLPDGERKRGRHIGREMMEQEFDTIWHRQAAHHPRLLNGEVYAQVRHWLTYQRPTFWRLSTIGACRLEPGERLCAKGSWVGQRFLLLQDVNSLRLAEGNRRPLSPEERQQVLALLSRQGSVTFGRLRSLLKLPKNAKFNYEIGGRKELKGNAIEVAARRALGDAWEDFTRKEELLEALGPLLFDVHYAVNGDRVEIRRANEVADRRGVAVAHLKEKYGLTPEQAEALAAIEPPPGWLRHSEKAIRKLLPYLEDGMLYSEAMDAAYPGHRRRVCAGADRLPSNPDDMPDVRNPTVNRALTETRKVVNNLLRAYGKPDLIRVELARELKLPRKVKERLDKRNKDNEALRKKAKKDLEEKGVRPTRANIEKWVLWQECDQTCPFSSPERKISFDALFGTGDFDVEHIFPHSRSLDNTLANKTLCHRETNIEKGNRSPFEAWGHLPDRWDEICRRVKGMKAMPEHKKRRILQQSFLELGSDDFSERHLRDTQYIAREVRDFLLRLYPPVEGRADPVETCNGAVTAQLRHLWGLNTILAKENETGKNREDHRHHAVDAIAVALTTPAFIHRMSRHIGAEAQLNARDFPLPWPSFRHDVAAAIERIVPSFRVERKLSGPLHEQTALGFTGEVVNEGRTRYHIFAKRKPVRDLSESEVRGTRDVIIRDPVVRALAQARLDEHGGNAKKAFAEPLYLPAKGIPNGRVVKKVRLAIKRQEDFVLPLRPERRTYAELGQVLHHIAIFRDGDRVDYEVVTRLDALRRVRSGKPPVRREKDGLRLVFSLCRGDVLEHVDADGVVTYHQVTGFYSNGQIFFRPAVLAVQPALRASKRPAGLLAENYRKVRVDPIGRVRPAND